MVIQRSRAAPGTSPAQGKDQITDGSGMSTGGLELDVRAFSPREGASSLQ
jgi:hypothetical protein